MKPHRPRSICGSHNPFTPSTALWQHFILPYRPLPFQQRLSSSVASNLQQGDSSLSPAEPPISGPLSSLNSGTKGEKKGLNIADLESVRASKEIYSGTGVKLIISKPRRQVVNNPKRAFAHVTDYEGVVVPPLKPIQGVKEGILPWIVRHENNSMGGKERLSLEIKNFHEYIQPTRLEALARRQLIQRVRSETEQVLPHLALEVFGSERTGLAFATSDIDLRLTDRENLKDSIKPPPAEIRRLLLRDLTRLQRHMSKKGFLLCQLRHARYPLIAMQDRESGLDVQIVLSNDTSLSRSFIQKYTEEYPYLPEVYSVVKAMLDIRGLTDVFRGGFGAYSIFMMIVAAFLHSGPPGHNAGTGVCRFLRFWGHFDTSTKGISIEPPTLFSKDTETIMSKKAKAKILNHETEPLPPFLLTLRDPADSTNDLGRKGICIKHLQATCRALAHQLQRDWKSNTRKSLLFNLVGPVYALNIDRRRKLEGQGRTSLMGVRMSQIGADAKQIREQASGGAARTPETQSPLEAEGQGWGDMITSSFGMPSVQDMAADEARERKDGRKDRMTAPTSPEDSAKTSEQAKSTDPETALKDFRVAV
ncbi:uncharacterized protein BDR25DRAFT_250510 [Lindgomyces ingoldianus]|uniref:Uncharacterized protein n=1 Tax=Lindgomyces ingoldianus TaxID=673940 RepID=A0ACB6RHM4_9PLEO|nr:uncharacterized protein BDR25DRAFT_250510 [Lindgomyces ingoldianus]KAF2478017.1 hypothetical protein BDR25DRAFT_250510 [Lindgomyces ingoldianus]